MKKPAQRRALRRRLMHRLLEIGTMPALWRAQTLAEIPVGTQWFPTKEERQILKRAK